MRRIPTQEDVIFRRNKPCRSCGHVGDIPDHRLRKCDYVCRSCKKLPAFLEKSRGATKRWQAKRRALGLRVSGRHDPEKAKAYMNRPEVKARMREADKRRMQRDRIKVRARRAIRSAVEFGKIAKTPCNKCGNQEAEKHHPDYSKPLEVVWLCRGCHLDEHFPARIIRRKFDDAAL